MASPLRGAGGQDSRSDSGSTTSPARSETDPDVAGIPLSYKGMSRTHLLSMWEAARTCSNGITPQDKEKMLNDVLDGLTHLQGATNEETTKVAYTLAGFYVDTSQSYKADKVLERQTQAYIERLGHDHRKTLQHVLHVAELLNAWNRSEDALGMLSKVREMRASRSRNASRIGKGHQKASG
ncbi:hypothetical protein B0T18DRAFT_416051 [Schizothecium vesticola]|uniref:Uncharacterized protein n=1 Tax=Schizothecium vesticola TaxID=314040 RepID=A0AA40K2U1_9PEZI|nr:hypothetical protein B0T18DRAFT_416051 [Schizothecium vesticola]